MLNDCSACVGGLVDCAVDFSPGGVWIGYIRPVLWDESLIDAAPVTGSLVSSALFDCLHVYCVTNLGEVRGQDHTNNEQTQSVDGII